MLEALICSEFKCRKLKDNFNLVSDQLQQPSASPIAPKGSETTAEPPVSTVSLQSLLFSSPECLGIVNPLFPSANSIFSFNASAFSSDRAKIVFIISHLIG